MVATSKRRAPSLVGTSALVMLTLTSAACGQVAFVPIVGAIPSGPSLTVTPVVTPDRRYVRLGVSAFFLDFNGFTTYSVPAAVGGQFPGAFAGMNGLIGNAGVGASTAGPTGFYGLNGEPLAGPVMAGLGPVVGDPFERAALNQDAAAMSNPLSEADGALDPAGGALIENPRGHGVRAASKLFQTHRSAAAKKSTHRRATAAQAKSR